MKSKLFIIVGAVLLVCAIVLGGLYISGASSTARFDKQLQLGNKYLLEENYEQAILAFEKAIIIEPKNIDARLGLAKAYVAVDRANDAVAVLEDAIEIDPKRPEPYINLAKIYIDRGELGKAIEILEAGMKNSGDSSIAAFLDEIKPKVPVASVESGKYSEAVTVTFEGIAVNDEVYYTLDNTPPSNESLKYSEPISLTNGSHVLRAAAYRSNGIISAEAMYEYQIDIPVQVIQFQDAAFEKAIRKMLFKETGEILSTDLIGIESICICGEEISELPLCWTHFADGHYEISGKSYYKYGQIRTLDDLKYFPDIRNLEIGFQEFIDISGLKGLTNLTSLTLIHIQISDIDISVLKGLTNLTFLILYDNPFSDNQVYELQQALPSCRIDF